ncbi:hypothetical protein VZG28_14570 (plasmid) [Synechococcus elongatus IITB4]|uniref:hypothetical protein n=1 Tax=Synechococcus elongatus TaxID=32046 RepID=UPI0030D11D33
MLFTQKTEVLAIATEFRGFADALEVIAADPHGKKDVDKWSEAWLQLAQNWDAIALFCELMANEFQVADRGDIAEFLTQASTALRAIDE